MNTIGEAEEAERIIKYALRLTLNAEREEKLGSGKDNNIDALKSLNHEVFKTCENIIPFGINSAFGRIHSEADPSYLSREFWEDLLFQDAVISVYSYFREKVGQSHPVTAYKAISIVNQEKEYTICGLDYLIEKKKILLTDCGQELVVNDDGIAMPPWTTDGWYGNLNSIASKNTAYKGTIYTICKCLKDIENAQELRKKYDKSRNIGSNFKLFLDDLELVSILRNKSGALSTFNSMTDNTKKDSSNDVTKIFKKITEFKDELLKTIETSSFTTADKIYVLSQIERIFRFELVESLYASIDNASRLKNVRFSLKKELDIFSGSVCLNNYFSRAQLMERAFSSLDSQLGRSITGSEDFFKDLFDPKVVVKEMAEDSRDDYFLYIDWLKQYSRFLDYIGSFLLPVYRSCFLVGLCKIHGDSLSAVFQSLSDVLNNCSEFSKLVSAALASDSNTKKADGGPLDKMLYIDCFKATNKKTPEWAPLSLDYIDSLIRLNKEDYRDLPSNRANVTRFYMMRSAGIEEKYV